MPNIRDGRWLCFNEWSRPDPYHLVEFELKDKRHGKVQIRKGLYCGNDGTKEPCFKSGKDVYLGSEIKLWRYQPPKENTCVEPTS